jgi:hypothetical protein
VRRGCSLPVPELTGLRRRVRKWLVHPTCRRLYRDENGDTSSTVLVAGTGRSGTTWVAELLGAGTPCRIMQEPFHARYVEAYRGFSYFQYMRPEQDDEALLAYCQKVFSGRLRHPWVDAGVATLRPQRRVIQEIRANGFLRWITMRFPEMPLVFVLRHPCAVVLSRMELEWDTDRDIAAFLEQPQLVSDHLGPYLDLIRSADSPAEKHAVVWCLSNLVPLRQFPAGELPVFFYEDLVRDPEAGSARLRTIAGLPPDDDILAGVRRPSRSATRAGAAEPAGSRVLRWKRELQEWQTSRILDVVHGFGLGDLYDAEGLPRLSRIHDSSCATSSPPK